MAACHSTGNWLLVALAVEKQTISHRLKVDRKSLRQLLKDVNMNQNFEQLDFM